MKRYLALAGTLWTLSAGIAAPTVVVNGSPTEIAAVERDGKAFVDAAALLQLLGGRATYDPQTGRLSITTAAAPVGGGEAPALADFGTSQLPGDNGELGKVYKLRSGNPLFFRLNSAEFTVSQVRFGNAMVAPQANEKLLVLHLSVQNPQQNEVVLRFDSLKFTAVDAMNVNHEAKGWLGDERTQGDLNMRLKPAQRIEAYVCVVMPAQGVVPKLMVMPPLANDGPILRYDLRGVVKPLPAPLADPADPSGATAREVVPAPTGTAFPLRNFDVSVDGFESVTTALDGPAPKPGDSYFVATLVCRNKTANNAVLRFDTFTTTLLDEGGQEQQRGRQLLGATGNRPFNQHVKPGEEARVRVYFSVPKDTRLKTFRIKEATSRSYEYNVAP